jgi:hypothetical protein
LKQSLDAWISDIQSLHDFFRVVVNAAATNMSAKTAAWELRVNDSRARRIFGWYYWTGGGWWQSPEPQLQQQSATATTKVRQYSSMAPV